MPIILVILLVVGLLGSALADGTEQESGATITFELRASQDSICALQPGNTYRFNDDFSCERIQAHCQTANLVRLLQRLLEYFPDMHDVEIPAFGDSSLVYRPILIEKNPVPKLRKEASRLLAEAEQLERQQVLQAEAQETVKACQ